MDIRPYRIDIPEATLADLRDRLERTRFPDEIHESGWKYGMPLGYSLNDSPAGLAAWIIEKFRAWAERVYNIRRWTEMPAGGHFAAMEEPTALVDDIRAFFRSLRG